MTINKYKRNGTIRIQEIYLPLFTKRIKKYRYIKIVMKKVPSNKNSKGWEWKILYHGETEYNQNCPK